MGRKRKLSSGFLIVAGYILSPLSWWNDAYVNIPISYALAWIVSLLYKPVFLAAFIAIYWTTNLAGFILLHKGAEKALTRQTGPYSKKTLYIDIAWSIAYTIVIIVMVKINIIKAPPF